jgi:hypothetical protein
MNYSKQQYIFHLLNRFQKLENDYKTYIASYPWSNDSKVERKLLSRLIAEHLKILAEMNTILG